MDVRSEASVSGSGSVEMWSIARLLQLIPGSTRKRWLNSWVPSLVNARVLLKVGKAWIGRRSAIESALLSPATEMVRA